MAVRSRASRHLPSIIGYCVLVFLVLLGLAAMHSGASAVMTAESHSTPNSATTAQQPAPEAAHETGMQPRVIAIVSAALAKVDPVPSSVAHGLMAGCVLALTGAIGLALARLLARSTDGPPSHGTGTRQSQQRIRLPGLAAPPPRARFSLCVLRT